MLCVWCDYIVAQLGSVIIIIQRMKDFANLHIYKVNFNKYMTYKNQSNENHKVPNKFTIQMF